mgnify:CR=1 FL=1
MILRRLLVANRGEIAVRVLRTCQRLGIETVLAASEADLDSVPARMADRTVCIGPAAPAASYLDVDAVVVHRHRHRLDPGQHEDRPDPAAVAPQRRAEDVREQDELVLAADGAVEFAGPLTEGRPRAARRPR